MTPARAAGSGASWPGRIVGLGASGSHTVHSSGIMRR